jgi:hypothetical protein
MSNLNDQALDYFCAELTRIDRLGCNRRLIFTIPSTEGGQWKTVQVKLIIPADYMVTLGVLIASDGTANAGNSLAMFEAAGEPN